MISKIKGTQDFLDLTAYNFLIDTIRNHLTMYDFSEIATPILEPLELFQRSLGLYTEVISKEMYVVSAGPENSDAQSKQTICLRPEGTASTMRAFFTNNIDHRPWKVFSHGPMFRHERPQKGRFRQFHQLTLETIGAQSIAYDAQLIAMLDNLFTRKLMMPAYTLKINFLGSPQDRATYKLILKEFLEKQDNLPAKINELKETNILRIFDLKAPECQKALENAPVITDYLSKESQHEWDLLQQFLDSLAINYMVCPNLVRGLDYYNKTVFEFVSEHLGAQNTFCGGGRYDYLSQELGEKEAVPSLGAALGIERVLMILEHAAMHTLPQKPPLVTIIPLSGDQHSHALLLENNLCSKKIRCQTLFDGSSIKAMMRQADKLGAQWVIIIGENEIHNNYGTIKDMQTGKEEQISLNDIFTFFTGRIND